MANRPSSHLAALLPAVRSKLTVGSRQTPTPGDGEVLIRARAIAVNPIDWKRQAWGFMTPTLPAVLGADLAGEVVAVGSSVEGFQSGDRVLAMAPEMFTGNNDHGAYQEYAVVKSFTTAKLPKSLSFTQAATLPSAVSTAFMMLVDNLGLPLEALETGKTSASSPSSIFVWGGSSAVGTLAIQLAHKAGLTVFATASAQHHDRLRELGADVVVDYSSGNAAQEILNASEKAGKPIAWAVDVIATESTLKQVVEVLQGSTATDAKKLSITVPWATALEKPENVAIQQVNGGEIWSRRSDLAEWLCSKALTAWLESGDIKPLQAKVVEGGLEGLQSAMDDVQKGVSGVKMVVEV